jgi:hypothetical protein
MKFGYGVDRMHPVFVVQIYKKQLPRKAVAELKD